MNEQGKFFFIKAHNFAGFDGHFVYHVLMTDPRFKKYKLKSPIFRGSRILKLEWNHKIFTDTANFLSGTLESLSESFDIQHKKLKDFVIDGQT